MNFDTIIITGDFFRYLPTDAPGKPTFATGNVRWLYDLLAPVITRASSQHIIKIDTAWDTLGIEDWAAWVKSYNRVQPSPMESRAIAANFGKHTLIIGFELSPYQQALFTASGIDWISLAISPVRFGADYYFTFTTNCTSALVRTLNSYNIGDYELKGCADYLKAGYRRFSKVELIPGSALFCGQVANDASLIEGDKIADVRDYHEGIAALAMMHKHLYYKQHPYAEGDEETLMFVDSLPNGSIIDADVYELISHDEIQTVAALSSSVLTEAKLFGKQTRRFLNNERDTGWTIDKHILTPNFWADILGYPRPDVKDPLVLQDKSPIRDALKVSWKHHDK